MSWLIVLIVENYIFKQETFFSYKKQLFQNYIDT